MVVRPLLKAAWISAVPTTGNIASQFRKEYSVGRLVNMNGCVWKKDRQECVLQVLWLCQNFDIVFGQFPPELLEAGRVGYVAFCRREPGWDWWVSFISPVFKEGGEFLRFANVL